MTPSSLVYKVFARWDEESILYAVLRKPEEIPLGSFNDIDVLVDPKKLKEAVMAARGVVLESGYIFHHYVTRVTTHVYAYCPDDLLQVNFDIFGVVKWYAFEYGFSQNILESRHRAFELWVVSDTDKAVINLLTRWLYNGYVKEEYRPQILKEAIGNKELLLETLRPHLGLPFSELALSMIKAERWVEFEALTPKVRSLVIKHRLLDQHIKLFFKVMRFHCLQLSNLINTPGVWVVLPDLDVSLFHDVADGMKKRLSGTYSKAGTLILTEEPDTKDYWSKIRLSLFRNNLVITPKCGNILGGQPDLILSTQASSDVISIVRESVQEILCFSEKRLRKKL